MQEQMVRMYGEVSATKCEICKLSHEVSLERGTRPLRSAVASCSGVEVMPQPTFGTEGYEATESFRKEDWSHRLRFLCQELKAENSAGASADPQEAAQNLSGIL